MGATRLSDVSGLPVNVFGLAFKFRERLQVGPGQGSAASLILMNMGNGQANLSVQNGVGLGASIRAFQTTQNADWAGVGNLPSSGSVSLPGLSITTFLFS